MICVIEIFVMFTLGIVSLATGFVCFAIRLWVFSVSAMRFGDAGTMHSLGISARSLSLSVCVCCICVCVCMSVSVCLCLCLCVSFSSLHGYGYHRERYICYRYCSLFLYVFLCMFLCVQAWASFTFPFVSSTNTALLSVPFTLLSTC